MRERPQQLTVELIRELPDAELVRGVFLRLVHAVSQRDTSTDKTAYIDSLNPDLQMVWGTELLDNELVNGGFEQYFYNSSHLYVQNAIDGLHLLDARIHADLLARAVAAVRAIVGDVSFRDERWRSAYVGAGDIDALRGLTESYWSGPLLEPMQAAYIRASPEQFTAFRSRYRTSSPRQPKLTVATPAGDPEKEP